MEHSVRLCVGMLFAMLALNASANSVSFDASIYSPNANGQIVVNAQYDFTDFLMFGGGLNLVYDSSVLEFVSFTQDDFSDSGAIPVFSPNGVLSEPGLYEGFGISSGKFFNGIGLVAGSLGVFVFNVIGMGDGQFDACLNGATLCLSPNLPTNPMVSLAGLDVTDEIFSDVAGLNASVVVPLPPALVFMVSSLMVLFKIRRKGE